MSYTDEQRRAHIYTLQTALYALSQRETHLTRVNPDGIYGAETAQAVREMQRRGRLPVTGQVDRDTWEFIFLRYEDTVRARTQTQPIVPFPAGPLAIRRGQIGSGIGMAQTMLWALGGVSANLRAVPITMVYDEATIAQLRTVRRLSGLPDGEVLDAPAWNALVALYRQTTTPTL